MGKLKRKVEDWRRVRRINQRTREQMREYLRARGGHVMLSRKPKGSSLRLVLTR